MKTVGGAVDTLLKLIWEGRVTPDTKIIFDVDGRFTDDFRLDDVRTVGQEGMSAVEAFLDCDDPPVVGEKILLI